MDSKSDLRIYAKELRKNLDIKHISEKLVGKIRDTYLYKSAKNVMIYYPLPQEINLLDLVNDNKTFYLPKIYGDNIVACPYNCELKKSDLNIYEPCSNPINPEILDLIIVPALAVDKNNYRLGYGGGFYDKFLAKYPNIKTLCAIPKELYINFLPRESFDIPILKVITT